MVWDKSYPTLSGDDIDDSVTQIRTNWSAIESVLSGEHAAISNALSGTHLYGRASIMFSGTYSQISALSSPATGALAWDTQCGVCRLYTGSEWPRITATYFSRLHVARSSTQVIAPATWTSIVFNAESYDSLDEYSLATNAITITSSGWYLLVGTIVWPVEASLNYQKIAGLYVGLSTRVTSNTVYGKEALVTEVMDIVNLSAGNTIYLGSYHSNASNVSVQSASLIITRLS